MKISFRFTLPSPTSDKVWTTQTQSKILHFCLFCCRHCFCFIRDLFARIPSFFFYSIVDKCKIIPATVPRNVSSNMLYVASSKVSATWITNPILLRDFLHKIETLSTLCNSNSSDNNIAARGGNKSNRALQLATPQLCVNGPHPRCFPISHHVSFPRTSFLCLTVAHEKNTDEYGWDSNKESYSQE